MSAEQQHWHFYSQFINPELASFLYQEMDKMCQRYPTTNWTKTKTFESKRRSAVFLRKQGETRKTDSPFFNYGDLPGFPDDAAPVLQHIWSYVEEQTKTTFTYALVHIYQTGEDTLSYHNDKEALNPPTGIFSISLGASRLFRLRPIGDTTGFCAEYDMISGSAIYMFPGCQSHYKHCVPVQKKIKDWRINITFRQNPLTDS